MESSLNLMLEQGQVPCAFELKKLRHAFTILGLFAEDEGELGKCFGFKEKREDYNSIESLFSGQPVGYK